MTRGSAPLEKGAGPKTPGGIVSAQTEKNTRASAPLSAPARALAQARCQELGERLTPARLAAYAELLAAKRALPAYQLMARLEARQSRKLAPLTVYRHLDFLTRVGLAHRIESTQSYLPCDYPHYPHDSQYLLCSNCGQIDEVHSALLESMLDRIASTHGFKPAKTVVEMSGLCGKCASG